MQLAIPVAFHVALSCNSLNTFKCSIVCCSHFKVGGKRDTGGRGKGNIEVSSENETSEMFCCSVAFVNFAVFLFSVDWSLLSYPICFQNHFPFPHSICHATNYAACSQLLRRSESGPPRAVHLYQWGPLAAGLQCYLTTHPNFIHSKWFPSSCQFLVK